LLHLSIPPAVASAPDASRSPPGIRCDRDPFVELLQALWGIALSRLVDELAVLRLGGWAHARLPRLSAAEHAEVSDFVAFLSARHAKARPRPRLTNEPR
jgi:hypothetical protein